MRLNTYIARSRMRGWSTVRGKLGTLQGQLIGQTLNVVTCGPSLNQWTTAFLHKRLKDEPLLAIKQAYDRVPGIADFHLINSHHRKEYDYDRNHPVVLMADNPDTKDQLGKYADIWLNLGPVRGHYFDDSLSGAQDFDDWTWDKRAGCENLLCHGPTIFFTVVPFLAIHLGVSRLITIGLDMAPGDTSHFYGGGGNDGERLMALQESQCCVNAQMAWWTWLKSKGVSWYRAKTDYPTGFTEIPEIDLESV